MHHVIRPSDVGIGLGGHDVGVAGFAAELYEMGVIPRIVFTGAHVPTTVELFPRGEAVHFREHALARGVPDEAILVEPRATNTGQNIEFTRRLLTACGIDVSRAILISRPYQQRRAYSTARKLWPELEIICASRPLSLDEYLADIGDTARVIHMLVGDTQRIMIYPDLGFAIPQEMPSEVKSAYERLVDAGYTKRLL
ncbi:YdcF family protein [Spirillospora sp. CA-294931]|uniref:YdcF family protein n=1 Tax=Spirillospora sp. CA-294931 TaxID=3240042 RepID=UPI003D8B7869